MPWQTGILEALRDWGLTVHESPGWRTRGSSDFDPRGHVCHHDVVPDQPGTGDTVPNIIIAGRSDLPGPLANFWLERDGDVHLAAAGRANHAGEGGWMGLYSNSQVWGTEANNLGTPADPWPPPQLAAWYRLCAATCEFSGFAPAMVCGHKEWAPTRKIDPHSIDMSGFRQKVAAQTKGGLTVAEKHEIIEAVREEARSTRRTVRRAEKREELRRAREDKADDRQIKKIRAELDALGPDED